MFGSQSFAKQILRMMELTSDEIWFYDDINTCSFDGNKVRGGIGVLRQDIEDGVVCELVIAVGHDHLRFRHAVFQEFRGRGLLKSVVHNKACVCETARVEEGCVVFPGAVVDEGVTIGGGSVLNAGVVVAHDSQVGECCFLGPAVVLAGNCQICDRCYLSSGSVFGSDVHLSHDWIVGANSTLLSSIVDKPAEGDMLVGTPATKKRRHG